MPYNTRRKSLSLSELGVHVPKRARAPSQPSPLSQVQDCTEPPNKKARCVPHFASPPGPMSPPKTKNIRIKTEEIQQLSHGIENTPPPSPGAPNRAKVETDGIKDEVVVGVIVQLEKTGNRPHTSKELAATLANAVPTIDSSTNPNALIQARLATYLRGPWPLMCPCPIGKQQENVHPRRVFYFLTSCPHQPIPDTSLQHAPRRIISPSLSSNTDDEAEEKYARQRSQLSPSPEVDLSSPELEEDHAADDLASMYSSKSSLSRVPSNLSLAHNRRAASPPLEREERDFKQTANELQQQRRDSQQKSRQTSEVAVMVEEANDEASVMSLDSVQESAEAAKKRELEDVAALFGPHEHLANIAPVVYGLSSPVLRPQCSDTKMDDPKVDLDILDGSKNMTVKTSEFTVSSIDKDDAMDGWSDWDTNKSPENIDLEELEFLFDTY